MNTHPSKRPSFLLISSLILFFWGILFLFFADNFGSHIRFFNDFSDRLVYAARGSWIFSGKIPYKDAFSEYPQVAVLFFSIPYAILSIFFRNAWPITIYYLVIYQFLVLLTAIGTLYFLNKLTNTDQKWRLLLLALPASVYFIYNRFDIVPVFFCVTSLYLFSQKKYISSAILLGCGVMVKWYMLLIVPIYLVSYAPLNFKKRFWMAAAFGLTILAFLVPTYLLGGLDAVLMPYTFHLDRGIESGSLLYFIDCFLNGIFHIHINNPWLMRLFFLLQFIAVPLVLTNRLQTPEQVIRWSAVSIIFFLIFAKFYSPQWWLWLLPLLIPLVRQSLDTAILIAFDLLTYTGFPFLYDLINPGSKIYIAIAPVQAVLLLTLAYRLIAGRFLEENWLAGRIFRKQVIA